MSDKEVPPDVMVNLIWLEAKQVLRGMPSEMFPDLTVLKARAIREMGLEEFKTQYLKGVEDGS